MNSARFELPSRFLMLCFFDLHMVFGINLKEGDIKAVQMSLHEIQAVPSR